MVKILGILFLLPRHHRGKRELYEFLSWSGISIANVGLRSTLVGHPEAQVEPKTLKTGQNLDCSISACIKTTRVVKILCKIIML